MLSFLNKTSDGVNDHLKVCGKQGSIEGFEPANRGVANHGHTPHEEIKQASDNFVTKNIEVLVAWAVFQRKENIPLRNWIFSLEVFFQGNYSKSPLVFDVFIII